MQKITVFVAPMTRTEHFLFIAYAIMAMAIGMVLFGCSGGHIDEPNLPDTPTPDTTYRPIDGLDPTVALFNGYEKQIGYTLWPVEKMPDSNLIGEGFSFDYWGEHKGEYHTSGELMALCEVPQGKLAAMSTRNLVLTCFVYPYNVLFNAYNNQYLGIMAAMRANCWQELMKRETGAAQLLDLYCELTYPTSSITDFSTGLSYLNYKEQAAKSLTKLSALTLAMMTAVDSRAFTPEQLTHLAGEIFNKIENMLDADEGIYSYSGNLRYPYLLGAFIAYHYDNALTPIELSLLYDLTAFLGLPGYDSVKNRYFTTWSVVQALGIVVQSLERIEQGGLQNSTYRQ